MEVTPERERTELEIDDWQRLETQHRRRADALTAAHRERAARGEPHPVEDFLFTYYSHRPARLRRWHPGWGRVLLGAPARERLTWRWYAEVAGSTAIGLDLPAFLADRGDVVAAVGALLRATGERPAQFGCFGLHEWAMAYQLPSSDLRHQGLALRLGPAQTDAVVEGHQIRCTHFDAYRFFAPEALALNTLRPTRATQIQLEQPGCLHASMDLYRAAYKLGPVVPGQLLLDCFELARDIRTVDMRASPYDLSAFGYEPIRIETPDGKNEYVAAQRRFAQQGAGLRSRLLEVLALAPSDGGRADAGARR